jgi:hypothetical protein
MRRWRSPRRACAKALMCGIAGLAACGTVAPASGAAALPDGRSYELVTPPANKNGADVLVESGRVRTAADGSAIAFPSVTGFGDVAGTGIATDYMSVRSSDSDPGSNGWSTHGITPPQEPLSARAITAAADPLYVGDLSSDLDRGVFLAWSPVTDDPSVAATSNLYVRDDLRTPGLGSYRLITPCPLCDVTGIPLPPLVANQNRVPVYAGASSDFRHVAFESIADLTSDTPAGSPASVYRWDDGQLSFAGYVPPGSAASCGGGGPACVAAPTSIAGNGVGTQSVSKRPLHVMSSDGSRLFFTVPTNDAGTVIAFDFTGRVYMRVDNTMTDELTASERTDCAGDPSCGGDGVPDPAPDAYAPALFVGASADGSRTFFTTPSALTDDAPGDAAGDRKLYMYDATKPAADAHNLTYLSRDSEFGGGTDLSDAVEGVIAISSDGRYVYFVTTGQLVSGGPLIGNNFAIYMWHDGEIAFIGRMLVDESTEIFPTGANFSAILTQARVTPDGRFLLLSSHEGRAFAPAYDHGSCSTFAASRGCRELYVWNADSRTIVCASCNPSGAPATSDAAAAPFVNTSPATTWHLNRAISDDGKRVFFTTGEALVSEDVNGRQDAYEYDVPTRAVHLISGGTDPSDSYFLEASPSGDDAFFATRQRLVGWDVDGSYDLYDARVGGGFPEPAPPAPRCAGPACQGTAAGAPQAPRVGSASFAGEGDLDQALKPHRMSGRCRRGVVKRRVKGKSRCVKRRKHKHRRGHRKRAARRGTVEQQRRIK